MKKTLLLLSALFTITLVNAQCIEQEIDATRVGSLSNGSWSQSFTPSCSGVINEVTFDSQQAVPGGASVVIGTENHCGQVGSTILSTTTLPSMIVGDNTVAIPNVFVVAGTVYYFKVTTTVAGETYTVTFDNGNPYAGGYLTTHLDASDKSLCDRPLTGFDWKFSVNITETLSTDDIILAPTENTIYPNPVENSFVISDNEGADLLIYNAAGQLVLNTKLSNNEEAIDVSKLNNGVYYISIRNNGVVSNQKIIKK